jgi:hypothetical protein
MTMTRGTFLVQAIEQIVFGTPLEEALAAEVGRYGARRVFVTSTRSLARSPPRSNCQTETPSA